MNIGGLIAKAAMLKNQKPSIKCQRCSLYYVKEEHDSCPHCGSLSEFELNILIEKLKNDRAERSKMGLGFAMAAVIITVLMLLSTTNL